MFRLLSRWPLASGVAIATVNTVAADTVVQHMVEKKQKHDWQRTAVFFSFGAVYLGGFQYLLYSVMYPRWFTRGGPFSALTFRQKLADSKGQAHVGMQLFVDQFIHVPFIYFPTFYLMQDAMQKGTVSLSNTTSALRRYADNFLGDNIAQWQVFLPANLINFTFCPLWFRVPFAATISFGWTMILSFRRGGSGSSEKSN